MIRWYDWLAAVVFAYFVANNGILVLLAPWYLQLLGAAGVWLLMDAWDNYCKFRLHQEQENE